MNFKDDINIKPLPVQKSKFFRKVDLRLPLDPVVCFIGSTSSGKTTNLLNLLTKKKLLLNYFKVFIFSRNFYQDSIWENVCIQSKYICLSYSEERIQRILDRQNELKEKQLEKFGNLDKFKPVLIIFDDMIGELRNKYLSILTSMNRHYNVHIMILSQSYKAVSPIIRTNCTNWIIYPSCNEGETKKMGDELGGKKFLKFMEYISQKDYQFLHIAKKSPVKIRYRKGYDKYLELKNNEVFEHKLILKWSDKFLKTKNFRSVKLNPKPKKKKKKKKIYFEDYFSSSESELSSDYSE